jgi:gluconate kinase
MREGSWPGFPSLWKGDMNVVIFVAGLPGTGKSSIARCLAEAFSIHYYDIDEVKKVVYPQDPDFEHNMRHGIPFKKETRLKVFEQVLVDFKRLARTYDHLVVDETLHLKEPRQVLFDGAKAYFGAYLVIWLKTDAAVVETRLRSKKREDHILKDPMKMYLSFAREVESLDESHIVCQNNGSLEQTTEGLFSLIQSLASLQTPLR